MTTKLPYVTQASMLEKCTPQATHEAKQAAPGNPCHSSYESGENMTYIRGLLPDFSLFLNSTEEDSCESQNIEKQETPKPNVLDVDDTSNEKETAEIINLDFIEDSEDDNDISIVETYNCEENVLQLRNASEKQRHREKNICYIDLEEDDNIAGDDAYIEFNDCPKVDKFDAGKSEHTKDQPQDGFSNEAEELEDNGNSKELMDGVRLGADDNRNNANIFYKSANRHHDVCELGDSDCDNDELLAFAIAAGDCMDDNLSDSELFSVTFSSLPKTGNSLDNQPMSSQLNINSPSRETFLLREENSNKGKSLKRAKKRGPKKKKSPKLKSGCDQSFSDICGFRNDCLRPHDREDLVEWVQCDYCRKWYHLECTGLTLDKVNDSAVKFNCGCVYHA